VYGIRHLTQSRLSHLAELGACEEPISCSRCMETLICAWFNPCSRH